MDEDKNNKLMSFRINDEKLLKKYNFFLDSTEFKIVWKKVTTFIK